jgi:multicomponent Na+:H+ antiporter subunit G
MKFALDIFTIFAVMAGAFFFLAGTVGLLRFPDPLTRLHALTKADNLGLGLVVLGLLPQTDWPLDTIKLVAIWLFALLAGATVGQLMACAARRGGVNAVELTPSPTGGRSGWGRPKGSEASDLSCPHPNPVPLGDDLLGSTASHREPPK